jgi:hypothetical protein
MHGYFYVIHSRFMFRCGLFLESVKRFVTRWSVRGSNPNVGEIVRFHSC